MWYAPPPMRALHVAGCSVGPASHGFGASHKLHFGAFVALARSRGVWVRGMGSSNACTGSSSAVRPQRKVIPQVHFGCIQMAAQKASDTWAPRPAMRWATRIKSIQTHANCARRAHRVNQHSPHCKTTRIISFRMEGRHCFSTICSPLHFLSSAAARKRSPVRRAPSVHGAPLVQVEVIADEWKRREAHIHHSCCDSLKSSDRRRTNSDICAELKRSLFMRHRVHR